MQYFPQTTGTFMTHLLFYYNIVLLLYFIKIGIRHCIVVILHRNNLFYLNIGKCLEIIVKIFILLSEFHICNLKKLHT